LIEIIDKEIPEVDIAVYDPRLMDLLNDFRYALTQGDPPVEAQVSEFRNFPPGRILHQQIWDWLRFAVVHANDTLDVLKFPQ
jgi:hypothetical protein